MNQVVSQSKIFIDGPMGNFQLLRWKDFDYTDDADAEVVRTVGVNGGAGVRFQTGGGSISANVFREQVRPEVDYLKEQKLRREFAITVQDVGGRRTQYQGCYVANVAPSDDADGNHMDKVKIIYQQLVVLPSAPV